MSITIITDSTADIAVELMAKRGIQFGSLKVLFGDREYNDKVDLTLPEFYEKLKTANPLPTTSQVNIGDFEHLFSSALNAGNEVIGIFLSSELSGTYNAATLAKQMLDSDRIHLIDSRTTSFALGMLVLKAQDLVDQGLDAPSIVGTLHEMIGQQHLYAMLDTLENLKRGGRISAGAAFVGNMLSLKPIITVKEGKVEVATKVRGSKKGWQWLSEQLLNAFPDKHVPMLGLAHANYPEKMQMLKELLLEEFQIDAFYESEIGTVVGTHTGEGAVGIVFYKI